MANAPTFLDKLTNNQPAQAAMLPNVSLDLEDINNKILKINKLFKNYIEKQSNMLTTALDSVFKSDLAIESDAKTIANNSELQNKIKTEINKQSKDIKSSLEDNSKANVKTLCKNVNLYTVDVDRILNKNIKLFSTLSNWFSGLSKKLLDSKFSKTFSEIFDNTVGRVFKWIGSYGSLVYKFISSTVMEVFNVFKWITDKAITIIGWVYNKLAALAKIGWIVISKVWEYITLPIKEVYSFFKEQFVNIISSPFGFALMVGGLVVALTVFGPKIKAVLSDIFDTVWGWVNEQVTDIFFKGDVAEKDKWFKAIIPDLQKFLSGVFNKVVKAYDEWIVPIIGKDFSSEKIKSWFAPDGIIRKTFSSIITTILPTIADILTDVGYVWEALTNIYYFFANGMDPQKAKLDKNLMRMESENSKRLNMVSIKTLQDYTESYLYESLMQFYVKNNLQTSSTGTKQLIERGNALLESFKNNFKFSFYDKINSDYTENVIRGLNIDMSKIAMDISSTTSGDFDKIQTQYKVKILENSQLLDVLKNIYDPKNIKNVEFVRAELDKFTDDTRLDSYKVEANTKAVNAAFEYLDVSNGSISSISENSALIFKSLNDTNKAFKNITGDFSDIYKTAKMFALFTDSQLFDIATATDSNLPIYIDSMLDTIKIDNDHKIKMVEMMKLYNKIEMKKIINYMSASGEPAKKATGGIAKNPQLVMVGEGLSPELILPLDKHGIDFIESSILDLLNSDKYSNNASNSDQNSANNVVRRQSSSKPKPDMKIFDMKNISECVVGVAR